MPSRGTQHILLSADDIDGYPSHEIGSGRRQRADHAGLLLRLGDAPEWCTGNFCRLLATESHCCFSSALSIHSVHGLISQDIFLAPVDDAAKLVRLDESVKGFLRIPLRHNKV